MVSEYVRAINEGGVPCIESALDVMIEKECREAYETALALYNKVRAGRYFEVVR